MPAKVSRPVFHPGVKKIVSADGDQIQLKTISTEFQCSVYETLARVPRGRITTYRDLAAHLHSAPRAIGQAMRKNAYAPQVPCHRVVDAKGFIGGFDGEWGKGNKVNKKMQMLKDEGIQITKDGYVANFDKVLFKFDDL
eukprot:Clim_evm48s253 gene=Clim_evmTU48s253